jgi:hypothetical protein
VIAFADEIVAKRGPSAAPIIYCDLNFANNEFDGRLADYGLWLRAIGADPNGELSPTATGVFTNWAFLQYSASGNSGGISPLDLDSCHNEYKALDAHLIVAVTNPVAPAIAVQPQSQTVSLGASPTFGVIPEISSSTPLSFQWQFNGTNIAGATTTAYKRTGVQPADAGGYSVIITNVAGSITSVVATLTVLAPVTLYEETFDSYSSPSTITAPATTNGFKVYFNAPSGLFDFSATFGFDYSTVTLPTTIPSAPHSSGGTTKGLRLAVNKDTNAVVAAVNLYPTVPGFTGDYSLKLDMWINWSSGAGSTEHAMFGVNHSGNVTNRIDLPTSDGLFFAVSGDGGVSATSATQRDYAVYLGGGVGAIPLLKTTGFGPAPLLGAQFDHANSGFVALFPSKSPPGSAGLSWVNVEVRKEANLITWFLNDTLVAQYTNTTAFTNGNILIGYSDNTASLGSINNCVIFDNVRVETFTTDVDGDGLPDAWETQYFGSTGANPGTDADGDGGSNLHEFLAGTNPTNAASAFRLLGVQQQANNVRLDWTTVGSHSYVLQISTNLATGFVDLSPVIPIPGSAEGTTNYLHLGGASNPAAYYRVRLAP